MHFLDNPFYILNATPHDNDKRIMDLAVSCGLFQDAARCSEAKAILMSPLKRIYAEIAWLPAKNSEHAKNICELLGSSQGNLCARDRLVQVQDLLGIDELMPIAKCNVLAIGLRRLRCHSSDALAAWILEFVHASEAIDAENLCEIINSDRKVAGSPTAKLPDIETEIENLRDHYRQIMTSALADLSADERAAAMTTVVESATDNERQTPLLINRLVDEWYDGSVHASLEAHKVKIVELDERLRAADENCPDSVLSSLVKQLTQAANDWERVAKPIQVSRESRGLSQDESKCVVQRVQDLAMHLFDAHDKLNFCMQLIGALQGAFNEVNEISNRLSVRMSGLNATAEERERSARLIIESQVKELRGATDKQQYDSDLSPMVTQLIEAVKYWKTSAQLCKKYYADFYIKVVANRVQELAHHFRNKHERFDDSRQLFEMLRKEFAQVGEFAACEPPHLDELDAARRVQGDITQQVSKLQTAADTNQPDSILNDMVHQLIQTVKGWKTCAQPIEAHYADYYHVANLVLELALHLRKKYRKLDISDRLFKTLREEFAELGEIGSLIDGHLKALETKEKKRDDILLQDTKLRKATRKKQPDSVLSEMVNQLIQTVKEWKTCAQPIEAYSTDDSTLVDLVMKLAFHLRIPHGKVDFSRLLFKTLQEEFTEFSGYATSIAKYSHALEAAERALGRITKHEKKLRVAVAKTDCDLGRMVNELIQAVKEWKDSAQLIKPYYANYSMGASLVTNLAFHLQDQHCRFDESLKLFKMLHEEFAEVDGIEARVAKPLDALEEEASARQDIENQGERLREVIYAKHPHSALSRGLNELIQTVREWNDLAPPVKVYCGDYCNVAKLVLKLAVDLRNRGKLGYGQLIKMLEDIFRGIPEIHTLLKEEAKARAQDQTAMKHAHRKARRKHTRRRGLR